MQTSTLQLQIGTHHFKVRVTEGDKPRMLVAARKVEEMLERYRRIDKVADGERAAVMVALQVASTAPAVTKEMLHEINAVLDEALVAAGSK